MENSKHKNQQAITPGVRAVLQAAIEQQHFKHVRQQQQTACDVNQQIERIDQRFEQIAQNALAAGDDFDIAVSPVSANGTDLRL